MAKKDFQKEAVIYQTKSGALELRGDLDKETVWATLDQIAKVFGRDKSVVSLHLKNIFTEGELIRNSVVAKNATTASEKRVRRGVKTSIRRRSPHSHFLLQKVTHRKRIKWSHS